MAEQLFGWLVLQEGALPLRPDGSTRLEAEHVCTSVLIWPEGEKPGIENTLLTDPCFTTHGMAQARERLESVGCPLEETGSVFITHAGHWDHEPEVPAGVSRPAWRIVSPGQTEMATVHLPGHHPYLHALAFNSRDGAIWVVGDAILDDEWLRAWRYYWPNEYTREEILQTWRSVSRIMASADVIVPGHGPPITVTPELLKELIDRFEDAKHWTTCPDVLECLEKRLDEYRGA